MPRISMIQFNESFIIILYSFVLELDKGQGAALPTVGRYVELLSANCFGHYTRKDSNLQPMAP